MGFIRPVEPEPEPEPAVGVGPIERLGPAHRAAADGVAQVLEAIGSDPHVDGDARHIAFVGG